MGLFDGVTRFYGVLKVFLGKNWLEMDFFFKKNLSSFLGHHSDDLNLGHSLVDDASSNDYLKTTRKKIQPN